MAGVRQRRLRARRAAHGRSGRPPRPFVLRAVLRRKARRGCDAQAPYRGVRSRLAGRVRPRRGDARAGRSSLGVLRDQPMTRAADQAPSRVRAFLRLVMIEHSVFALPFAYIAALTAMWRETRSVHWVQLLLITIAMVSARTVAMSANRILDRDFDALNPRTARRELVTGEMTIRAAWTGPVVALALAPVAVALLVLYSYGKRFTDYPQVLLALAQMVAPVGAWLAVTGDFTAASFALGLAVG